jgi:hypothetical protein
MTTSTETPVYYFGCWDQAGHYLVDPSGRNVSQAGPFTPSNLDVTFPPRMSKPGHSVSSRSVEDETIVVLEHWQGWTVLAMWDRSIDTRGASNAAFIAEGKHTHDEMWELARRYYPKIVARLKAAMMESRA